MYGRDGRQYLDFLAGFGACNVGHNHPHVVAAAQEQMSKMIHTAIGVTNYEPLLYLAEELGKILPGNANVFFFGNSGTEAARRVLQIALDKGLLLYPCGHWNQTIRLIPALNVTQAQINEGFNIFTEAVLEAQKEL